MIRPLLRCIVLLMASVAPLSGAPIVEARQEQNFDVSAALGGSGGRELPPVVLRGVNGTKAQNASVRACWNGDALFFVFDCTDRAIVSPGVKDGLDHFRLGDTVEVFIGRRGESSYAEIHATPAGKKSLYFFDGYRRRVPVSAEADRVRVASATTGSGWRAVLSIPWSVLGGKAPGEAWDVFFGRYDYEAEGGAPVLSSFPAQHAAKPDFHRREDYAIMRVDP